MTAEEIVNRAQSALQEMLVQHTNRVVNVGYNLECTIANLRRSVDSLAYRMSDASNRIDYEISAVSRAVSSVSHAIDANRKRPMFYRLRLWCLEKYYAWRAWRVKRETQGIVQQAAQSPDPAAWTPPWGMRAK